MSISNPYDRDNRRTEKNKRKMKIKRSIVLFIVSIIVVDYIYQYYKFQEYNQSPLEIKTPEGSSQPYHPSVIYIKEGWNGYKYWMAETPYPLGENGDWKGLPPYRERWENPCIHVSNDGIHWEKFKDLHNPIDDLDPNNMADKDYFSDPHLTMYKDTLECWYRISHKKNNMTYILRKYTLNGKDWSAREIMIDLQDSSTIHNETGNMVISPVIHKNKNGYTMWYVNNVEKPREICRSYSTDGKKWSKKETCHLSGTFVIPWHIDVAYIDEKYYLVVYDNDATLLTLWQSPDGEAFEYKSTLLSKAPMLGSFYSYGLYRSSLIKDDNEYKLYFSAFEKRTALGLMKGTSIDSLQIYSAHGKHVSFYKFPIVYLRNKKQTFKYLFELH